MKYLSVLILALEVLFAAVELLEVDEVTGLAGTLLIAVFGAVDVCAVVVAWIEARFGHNDGDDISPHLVEKICGRTSVVVVLTLSPMNLRAHVRVVVSNCAPKQSGSSRHHSRQDAAV